METPSFIEIYPNALSSEFCNRAIEMVDTVCARYTANNRGIGIVDKEGRKDISIFPSLFESLTPLVSTIESTVEKYWYEYTSKYKMSERLSFIDHFDSTVKIQKSSAGGGFTKWHTEHGSTESSMGRFAVWMFYLNDVDKGGTTDFKYYNLSVKPTQGTLLIWPASFTHMHRASPDLQQDKYISTGWFNLNPKFTKRNVNERN